MITKAKVKKWGSSLGIVIPTEIVHEEQLKPGTEIIIDVHKKGTLWDIFGTLKTAKLDSQKIKDQARKDWGD